MYSTPSIIIRVSITKVVVVIEVVVVEMVVVEEVVWVTEVVVPVRVVVDVIVMVVEVGGVYRASFSMVTTTSMPSCCPSCAANLVESGTGKGMANGSAASIFIATTTC